MCNSSQNIRSQANCSREQMGVRNSFAHSASKHFSSLSSSIPLSFFIHFFFPSLFFSSYPVSPKCFCTVWFAQHETRCKLICTANQIRVSVSDLGLHSCHDWALMLSGRVFNSDWLSLCFLTCCCLDVRRSEVSSSSVSVLLSLPVTIPTFPQRICSQILSSSCSEFYCSK